MTRYKLTILAALVIALLQGCTDQKAEIGLSCLEAPGVFVEFKNDGTLERILGNGKDDIKYNYKINLGDKTYFCAKQYQVKQ